MDSRVWQLAGHRAELRLPRLSASLDLSRPAEGLGDLHPVIGLGALRLLGIEGPEFSDTEDPVLVDELVRGTDLLASYGERSGWPVHVDARWQAIGTAGSDDLLGTVDLIVSVRTERLDSHPAMSVVSSVPGGEVLRLVDHHRVEYESILAEHKVRLHTPGPGCVVIRPDASTLSYAEMVHPADFRQAELTRTSAADSSIALRYDLFPERLEKGVILRARVRGAVLARADDLRLAAACYAALASAEPPLS